MNRFALLSVWQVCLLLLGMLTPGRAVAQGAKLDFDREVRPILAENCFACHGPDANKRQAGLRFDIPEIANQKLASGHVAIVPGKPAESELLKRVSITGPMQMPPVGAGKKLTPQQVATLRIWILQGGRVAPHWAFVPPQRPPLPPVQNTKWARNPMDRFILARLEQEGMAPSPEADKITLLRRVSFDLTGLPPTLSEVDAFLQDKSPNAYEKAVDRLLASPHYGERMAVKWLDLARYADTHGYHIDSQRDMWKWREWVIAAYNQNMPFDQFTIEQLAGDLLPNATLQQKIATGFNRNHPIDFEGGAIPEEYQAAYVFDRVDTTATTWMGLTMRCAQCHDHKYDPITQKDYYRFFAFFNTISENGLDGQTGNAAPFIKSPTPEEQTQLDTFKAKIDETQQALKTRAAETTAAQAQWQKTAPTSLDKTPAVAAGLAAQYRFDEANGDKVSDATGKQPAATVHGRATWVPGKIGGAFAFDGNTYLEVGKALGFERTDKFSYGAWVYLTSGDASAVLSRMDDANNFRGYDLYLSEGRAYVHIINKWEDNAIRVNTNAPIELNQWNHVFVTYDGSSKAQGVKIYFNGKPTETTITHNSLTGTIQTDKPFTIGRRTPGAPFHGNIDELRIYDRDLSAAEVAQLVQVDLLRPLFAVPEDKRTAEQNNVLANYYLENYDAPYAALSVELADWQKKRTDLDKGIPTTMIMEEMAKPRETHILVRGQYDHPGEVVTPALPGFLPGANEAEAKERTWNRLMLAKWLVSPTHPLTSRVAVNRAWEMLFGTGLVKTSENFGTQGERPSHPELLDWLATEFIRTKWDVKGLMRLLVTSATYRQASQVTPALLKRDPEDRLLSRFPRARLAAEFVRDQALAISGLLVDKLGGPSVKPYQPAGLWEEMAFGGGFSAQRYEQDHGESLYRRSMYTFWKRTVPPPSLQTFDAPEREVCMVRRSVTNTPLQALILMNDPTYVEASRKFAERIMTEGGLYSNERVQYAFRLATSRLPKEAERKVLLDVYKAALTRFHNDGSAAQKLLMVGESKRNEKLDAAELAAWTTVANVLLNLDETVTKS